MFYILVNTKRLFAETIMFVVAIELARTLLDLKTYKC